MHQAPIHRHLKAAVPYALLAQSVLLLLLLQPIACQVILVQETKHSVPSARKATFVQIHQQMASSNAHQGFIRLQEGRSAPHVELDCK